MFLKSKTLDQILGGFHETRQELTTFIAEQRKEISDKSDEIALLEGEIFVKNQDATRAERVVDNINNLLNQTA